MQAKVQEKRAEAAGMKGSGPRQRLRGHHNHNIPKIFDKQIPLHNFGMTFDNFSPPHHKKTMSRVWYFDHRRQIKSSEPVARSNYNRPVHLLREYLDRKQKYAYQPVLTNPESSKDFQEYELESKQLFKTANEFRIKKNHRRVILESPHFDFKSNEEEIQATQLDKTDKDFSTFNSKNLYEMTVDELQESIEWKKRFLDMINRKHKASGARNTSYLNKL